MQLGNETAVVKIVVVENVVVNDIDLELVVEIVDLILVVETVV